MKSKDKMISSLITHHSSLGSFSSFIIHHSSFIIGFTTVMSLFSSISESLLDTGIDVRIKTCGISMFPLIRTDDRIVITSDKNIHIGDMIVFKRGETMFCHRLARIFDNDGHRYFQTIGDSHFRLDEPITIDQILGKVVKIERENVSIVRRLLLLLHPALRFGRLNAIVINALIRIRNKMMNDE